MVWCIRYETLCVTISPAVLSLCNRSCNKVADCLAFYGAFVLFSDSEVFINEVPDYVKDFVLGDLPNIV